MVTPAFLVDAVMASLAGDGGPAWFEVWVDEEIKRVALVRHDGDLHQLFGWSAPDGCPAVAIVAGGRPRAIDDPGGKPPPPVPQGRARVVAVVDREGRSASCTIFADGTSMEAEGGEGRLADAMRRTMGLATPPPPGGSGPLIARLWLARLLEMADRTRGALAWDAVTAAHPAVAVVDGLGEPLGADEREALITVTPRVWTWDRLREDTAAGAGLAGLVSAEVAAWMDDGMFARLALEASDDDRSLWGLVAGALDEDAVVRLAAALDDTGGGCMVGPTAGYSQKHG